MDLVAFGSQLMYPVNRIIARPKTILCQPAMARLSTNLLINKLCLEERAQMISID